MVRRLLAGQAGVQCSGGTRDFCVPPNFQNVSGGHPAIYSVGSFFLGVS